MRNDTRPKALYMVHPTMDCHVIRVAKGTPGFWAVTRLDSHTAADSLARKLNHAEGYADTPEMHQAMLAGSMFGWDVPGAFPEAYTGKEV